MNRIKELRAKHNMSQKDLAKIGNVSPSSLSGYETEQFEGSLHTYQKIAEYFNVTLDYLLGGPEGPEPVQLPAPFPEMSFKFDRLDEMDRARVLAYMDGILAGEKYTAAVGKKRVG